MTARALDPPFPCPFCQSSRVVLVGGGLVFLHYKCEECAEVWTAMSQPRPAFLHPDHVRPAAEATRARPDFDDLENDAAFDEGAWPTDEPGPTTLGGRTASGGPSAGSRPSRVVSRGGGRKQKFWRH